MAWLDKSLPIYLYGYSEFKTTKDKAVKLKVAGYKVLGYIDRNAKNIRNTIETNCYAPDEIPEALEERKSIQVVIMLQNANLHEAIRRDLITMGFRYILYAPISIDKNEDIEILKSYEAFVEDDFEEVGLYNTISVSVQDIYIAKSERFDRMRLTDANMYYSIIEYALNKGNNIEEYCRFMGKNDEKFLDDRRELFKRLLNLYHDTPEYFKYAAGHAIKENDTYTIIDGSHRAAFLAYMGEKKIYLRVKKGAVNL
ncbi:MAG: hypothetical protein K6E46_02595 [Lachnospiraceae bacterium]|nr:hypothetical protein [Lachnospiraceae bacterium]